MNLYGSSLGRRGVFGGLGVAGRVQELDEFVLLNSRVEVFVAIETVDSGVSSDVSSDENGSALAELQTRLTRISVHSVVYRINKGEYSSRRRTGPACCS